LLDVLKAGFLGKFGGRKEGRVKVMTLDDLTPDRAERWQRQLDRDIRLHYQEHFDLTPYFEAMLGLRFWLTWQEMITAKPTQTDRVVYSYINPEDAKEQYESYKDSVAAWLVTGFVIPPKPDPEPEMTGGIGRICT